VSTYAFVNPIIALGLAWVVGDGELSSRTAAAAILVVGAVVFTRERAVRTELDTADDSVLDGSTLERALPRVRRRGGGISTALFSGFLRQAEGRPRTL
jgi:hypothetical protein